MPQIWHNANHNQLADMEDAHTHLLSLPDDADARFFAVYDGHGGAKVSEYAGKHLHKKIVTSESYGESVSPHSHSPCVQCEASIRRRCVAASSASTRTCSSTRRSRRRWPARPPSSCS